MNKKMMLSVLGIVAVSASAAFAGTTPGSGVVGSVHDMTTFGTGLTEDQGRVCAYCHTPHHAMIASDTNANDYMPLWSHDLPDTRNYTAYDSATIDATISPTSMMEGPSKLCMSCHDGAVAIDTHYATGSGIKLTGDSYGDGALVAKGSLSNDHPIGFIFDATDTGGVAAGPADGDPAPTLTVPEGQDKWIRNKEALYLGNTANLKIKDRLYLGTTYKKPIMTCATCHDVHNKKSVADGPNHNYLLLSPNTGSKICLTCHIK